MVKILEMLTNGEPSILIIVPAYNEQDVVESTLARLQYTNDSWDILVVNDGSTDRTAEIVDGINYCKQIKLPCNLGIGGAVQTGFLYALKHGYDIAVQVDADGQHFPHQIVKLTLPIMEGKTDVTIGSRYTKKHLGFKSSKTRRYGNYFLNFLTYMLVRENIKDNTSGFRAFNRRAIEFLAGNYPTDYPEPEVVVLLATNNMKIKEVFTPMQERQGGVSSLRWKATFYLVRVFIGIVSAASKPNRT